MADAFIKWLVAFLCGGAVSLIGADPGDLISFFGTDPIGKQTINLSSNNMGYTSVTASNYLYALNNLIGILKNKYGLIL